MSALLEKPKSQRTVLKPRALPKIRRPLPSTVPDVHLKARIYVRQRTKPSVVHLVLAKVALFGGIMALTYGASGLAGQVMVESARQQRLEAFSRANEATHAVDLLSVKVDRLTSSAAIDQFAADFKMTPNGMPPVDPRSGASHASR